MSNLDNKNKNILVENLIVFFLFTVFLILGVIFLGYKKINSKKTKNLKLDKFKNKLQSTQTNIDRIFLREEDKTFSNPNINIYIGIYDNEENINRKSNIHRARPVSYTHLTLPTNREV